MLNYSVAELRYSYKSRKFLFPTFYFANIVFEKMYSSLLRRPETSATANDIRFNPINPLLFLRAIKICVHQCHLWKNITAEGSVTTARMP